MGDYRKLGVWDKAHKLTLHIYQVTKSFPKDEIYGVTSQIRRSAMSVPSNLAEGSGRGGDGELIRFTHIAAGSAHELDYQILLSYHLGYLTEDQYKQLDQEAKEVKRMLAGFIQSLESKRRSI